MTTHRPVIVGVGQSIHAATDQLLPQPVDLALEALVNAFEDAGLSWQALRYADSLDAVNVLCWRYAPDFAHAMSERLRITPRHCVESPVGGQQPVAILDRLSRDITSGRRRFGIICGAEAQASVKQAKRAGQVLPWPAKPDRTAGTGSHVKSIVHPELWRHGLRFPVQIYPLFENAYRARQRQHLAQAQRDSAQVWATMSQVAAENPFAWYRTQRSAEDVMTPSENNRWIYFPYTKMMNAAPNVDQGAAILVLDEELALSLGIARDKFVYPIASAGAVEIADPLSRPTFARSAAMEATLDCTLERSGRSADAVDALELYSCFPVVPKMARDHLQLGDRTLTVAGGLSFFGGPGNDYMLHAVASMTTTIRERGPQSVGFAYGQGEFVTKHHAITLSGVRPSGPYIDGTSPLDAQPAIDSNRFTRITEVPTGPATVETYTAAWDPATGFGFALIVGRLISTDERFVARADDPATVQALTSGSVEGVGTSGYATASADFNRFRMG